MSESNQGEICDAFVPLAERDYEILSKLVGPPLGEIYGKE
jgi:hypothetical protein